MSRVAKCLDNQPIESFWGTLKSERFYLNKYHHSKVLIKDIEDYIRFYNHERITLKYNGLTPIEIRNKSIALHKTIFNYILFFDCPLDW